MKEIALIIVACCHYPCGYDPNLNMENCYVYYIDSYPILRFGTYSQGKKWADIGSYTTECILYTYFEPFSLFILVITCYYKQ